MQEKVGFSSATFQKKVSRRGAEGAEIMGPGSASSSFATDIPKKETPKRPAKIQPVQRSDLVLFEGLDNTAIPLSDLCAPA